MPERPGNLTPGAIDPSVAPAHMQPLEDFVSGVIAEPRFNATLLETFAAIALLLRRWASMG